MPQTQVTIYRTCWQLSSATDSRVLVKGLQNNRTERRYTEIYKTAMYKGISSCSHKSQEFPQAALLTWRFRKSSAMIWRPIQTRLRVWASGQLRVEADHVPAQHPWGLSTLSSALHATQATNRLDDFHSHQGMQAPA